MKKIRIGHDGKGFGSGWHLKEVKIESLGQTWICECNRWLDKNEDDGKLERELDAVLVQIPQRGRWNTQENFNPLDDILGHSKNRYSDNNYC